MKNRNVILAAIVLISAIGSSVASAFFAPQNTWIKAVKNLPGGGTAATCSTLGLLCDTQVNGKNCEVKVTLESGPVVSTIGYGVQSSNICSIPRRTATDRTFVENSDTEFVSVEAYQ
jgi:hypothetical protein